jgi:membrane glycosyltransferase
MRAILLIIAGAGLFSAIVAPMFLLFLLGAICMTIVGWEVLFKPSSSPWVD